MKSNDFSIVNNKYQWFYCHPCRPRYLTTNHCQILGSLSTFTPLKPLLYIFEIGARAKSTTGRTINVGERVGTTGFASSKLVVNAWPPIYIASDERMTPEKNLLPASKLWPRLAIAKSLGPAVAIPSLVTTRLSPVMGRLPPGAGHKNHSGEEELPPSSLE